MSEVSKVSFKGGFHISFPSKVVSLKQKEKSAENFLGLVSFSIDSLSAHAHAFDAKLHNMYDLFTLYKNPKRDYFYRLKNVPNELKLNNPNIKITAFNISTIKKPNIPISKILTAFVIKDKKNKSVDIYGFNKAYELTFDDIMKARESIGRNHKNLCKEEFDYINYEKLAEPKGFFKKFDIKYLEQLLIDKFGTKK